MNLYCLTWLDWFETVMKLSGELWSSSSIIGWYFYFFYAGIFIIWLGSMYSLGIIMKFFSAEGYPCWSPSFVICARRLGVNTSLILLTANISFCPDYCKNNVDLSEKYLSWICCVENWGMVWVGTMASGVLNSLIFYCILGDCSCDFSKSYVLLTPSSSFSPFATSGLRGPSKLGFFSNSLLISRF